MTTRKQTKLIHGGHYVAEVDVDLIETGEDWSPYLSVDDAAKLDNVRDALRHNDIARAARLVRVYTLTPITS